MLYSYANGSLAPVYNTVGELLNLSSEAESSVVVPSEPPVPGSTYTVNTLADMLALTGLEIDDTVTMLGREYANDGGGGVFKVSDSGNITDSGTVFVPDEYSSDLRMFYWQFNSDTATLPLSAGEQIIHGSYYLDLFDPGDPEVTLETLPGELLHGHRWQSRLAQERQVNIELGQLRDTHKLIFNFFLDRLDSGRAGRVNAFYKVATSPIRLVRQGVTTVLNARWFGAKTVLEDSAFNNRNVICHMSNTAVARNLAGGAISTLLFPNVGGVATTYGYFGSVALGNGLTLSGSSGTEVVDATSSLLNVDHGQEGGEYVVNDHTSYFVDGQDITISYRPARVRSDATTLKLIAGEQLRTPFMLRAKDHPYYQVPDIYAILDGRSTSIYLASHSTFGQLKDIVLDGDYLSCESAMSGPGGLTHTEKETWMRKSPGFAGFVSTSHGGVVIPVGQQVHVTRAAITGFGNSSVLGNNNNEWTGTDVLLGNTLWNHAFYSANGTWTNLTFKGFAWTHCVWQYGIVNNLVYEQGAISPAWTTDHNVAPDLFNIRGPDSWDQAAGVTDGTIIRSDGSVPDCKTRVNGFFMDCRGAYSQSPFDGIGFDIEIKEGVVITDPTRGLGRIYYRNANNAKAINSDNHFHDITYFHTGILGERVFGPSDLSYSSLKGLKVINARLLGSSKSAVGAMAELRSLNRSHSSWLNDKVFLFEDIDLRGTVINFFMRADIWATANKPTHTFVIDCHVNNTSSTIFQGPAGNGVLASLTQNNPAFLPVYLRDCSFNVKGAGYSNMEIFWALCFFDNCVDGDSGRLSEASGVFAMPSSGATALIPTNLMWAPHANGGVLSAAAAGYTVLSTEAVTAAGDALGANKRAPYMKVVFAETVPADTEITWNAAVREWPIGADALIPATP